MRRKIVLLLLSLFFIISIIGCSSEEDKDIANILKQEMSKNGIKYGEIYHIEVVNDGVLVFFEDLFNYGLSYSFLRNTQKGWVYVRHGGVVSLNPEDDFSFGLSGGNKELPLYFSYGIVNNPDVNMLTTYLNNREVEEEAKIIQTKEGLRIWFAFYENIGPPFHFIGIDKDGEEVLFYGD